MPIDRALCEEGRWKYFKDGIWMKSTRYNQAQEKTYDNLVQLDEGINWASWEKLEWNCPMLLRVVKMTITTTNTSSSSTSSNCSIDW